jgi:hypothetical protein
MPGRQLFRTTRAAIVAGGLSIIASSLSPLQAQTANKLTCSGNNSIVGADIKNGAIGNADLADGAIGPAKQGLANTIYLEDTGSVTDNCADLRDALAGLTGPAVVVLGPGTFDCGFSPVIVGSQVSLIGSGQNITTITGRLDGIDGLVRLQGDEITLRNLTVVNDDDVGGGARFSAVVLGAGGVDTRDWRISDVEAIARGGSEFTVTIRVDQVDCDGGEMINVTATSTRIVFGTNSKSRAVQVDCTAGSVTASNLKATGSEHVLRKRVAGTMTVRNSSFTGEIDLLSIMAGP